MKFKNGSKRFLTLNPNNSEGFTLVELIVVIAILAILAGVAVPAYNGYIEKANKASDEALLAHINTAFAAACVDNGTDIYLVDSASITLKDNGTVNLDSVSPYGDAFRIYYKDLEDSAFTVANAIYFNSTLHAFTVLPSYYSDLLGLLDPADIAALANSTFITADGLGVSGLLNKVDFVASFAAALDSSTYDKVLGSAEYKKAFLENLGVDTSSMTDRKIAIEYGKKLTELTDTMYAKMTVGMELTEEESEYYRSLAESTLTSNMAVMHAAQNTGELTTEQITTLLNSNDPKSTIINALSGDSGQGLSEAALYYGMFTAYAYHTGDPALIESTNNPLALLNSMSSNTEIANFQTYVNSDAGQADLQAYLSSMNMITTSTSSADAVSNVLTNGFSDPELIALLQQAIGG